MPIASWFIGRRRHAGGGPLEFPKWEDPMADDADLQQPLTLAR